MPNHICNIVKVKGDSEEVKNFMKSVAKEKAQYKNEATGYGTIDFNKVIPEPEYKNNTDWYDWRIQNWGTKWNAYEHVKTGNENELYFLTAWSAPKEIYEALTKKFPNLTIEVDYADENMGYNCGKMVFENGEMVAELKTQYSRYSVKLAKQIWEKYNKLS